MDKSIAETKFTLAPALAQTTHLIAEFPLSLCLLSNDSQFPWFILVPKIADVTEIYQLSWQQQQQLLNESSMLSEFLMSHYQGDKLNIAAIGNICSQLHLHHVVRFKTDKCWPQPIWGKYQPIAYTTEQLAEINATIGKSLQQIVKELPSQ